MEGHHSMKYCRIILKKKKKQNQIKQASVTARFIVQLSYNGATNLGHFHYQHQVLLKMTYILLINGYKPNGPFLNESTVVMSFTKNITINHMIRSQREEYKIIFIYSFLRGFLFITNLQMILDLLH